MKTVKIKQVNKLRKYVNFVGKIYTVFNSIDNFGDYCIAHDKGQPFMFISAKYCVVLFNS